MSTTRRLLVTLTALGLPVAATLWFDSAHAQQRIIRGGVQIEGMTPGDEQTMEGLAIPKDREATAIIAAAADYIKKKDWETVARSLQYLLEKPEDSFFEVTRKDENGKDYTTRVSIRIEANRLIGELPPEGLETYRQKYGQRALTMLQEGIDKNDPMLLSKVALKYRHTEAGTRAIKMLGDYFLDRGNYQLASGKFQELLELLEKEKPEVRKEIAPKTFYKAALAYQRFGDRQMSEKLFKQVAEMLGDKGLQLSAKGETYTMAKLKEELDRDAHVAANTLVSVPLVRGDPSRTALGIGGPPFLESRWSVSMFVPNAALKDDPDSQGWIKTSDWVQERIRNATDLIERGGSAKKALLPGFFPIAGNNRLIFRTYDGVYSFIIRDDPAQGRKAGELDWACAMLRGTLHQMGSDQPGGNRSTTETWWTQYSSVGQGAGMPGILFENSAVGTLSHDNKYVYCVDDLALPPHPNSMNMYGGGFGNGSQPFGQFSEQVMFNSMMAIEMETGRLKWEIGERKQGSKIQFPNPNFGGVRRVVGADGKVKMMRIEPDGTEVEIDPKTGQPIKKAEEVKPFVPPKEYVAKQNFVNAADELMDCYFLGAPLSIGGRLYVLVEYNGEIQLCCINPDRVENTKVAGIQKQGPELVWRQPLGTANMKLMQDSLRRIQPCHLAYNDGILICPTNAGAIIAVNLLNQSLSWAYSYRTGKDPNNPEGGPNQPAMMRGGRFRGEMMGNVNMGAERWYPAPPAIVNGNVIFTAPDSNAVVCLSLRDGKRIWSVNRQPGDLYMAGVYNNKVLIVAKDAVRALKLSDGSPAWDRPRPIGMPSGQGVASKGKYYLPCKNGVDSPEPTIVEINVDTGETHATKSRKKEIPGNLVFYDGEVISQSIWKVSAYPQLHVKLAEMNARLKKNPDDPVGLTDRGELHLDKNELTAAVDDLKKALSFNPDPDTRSRARLKLYDSLTEMLQKDFNKGEEHLTLYKDLCLNEVAGEEKVKRQSAYLTILGKGREAQGKLVEAFDAYMEFGQLNGAKELVPSVDEPGTLARPDVWARGRIMAMIRNAKLDERKPLEDRVAKQWDEVKATDNVEKIRAFVKVFGSMFRAGKEATLLLADKLTPSTSQEDQRFVEASFLTLRSQRDDLAIAAQATEAFARFLVKKNMLKDAVHIYRILGTEFKDVKLRDGRTGADVYNELVTDKRFLPYLETSAPVWGQGKMKGERVDGPFNQMFNAYFNVEIDGDNLPFFQQHRLQIHTQTNSGNGYWEARLVDRATGETKFKATNLPPNGFINQNFGGPGMNVPSGGGRIAQARGHLLMLTMSHMVYVWDMSALDKGSTPKAIISQSLLGEGVNPQQQGSHVEDGTYFILYADGSRLRVGQGGLLESSYVCLPTRDGLVARDPTTGNILWKRDTGSGAHLFGDAEYIFAVESGTDGAPSRTQVVRAADGVSVKVPDFSQLYHASRRVSIVGRNLLVFDDDPKGGKALRLYDVLTGKDVWRQTYPAGSKVIRAQEPGIAGVLQADGTLTVVAADTGKALVKVADADERIQAEHLNGLNELTLLQDRDSFYVVLNKAPDNMSPSYPFVTNGLKSLRIHGALYSYSKSSGKLDWFRDDLQNQYMILENFDELPIVIFGTMMQGRNQAQGKVEALEKKTGRLMFDKQVPSNGQFHAMHADAKKGEVELQRYDLKIKFTQEGKGGAGGKDDKPMPGIAEPKTVPRRP